MTLNDILKQARQDALEAAADREAHRRRQYLRQHLLLIQCSAMGVSRKQMASELGVSIRTVEQRFDTLYEMLGCNSAAHLVGRAFALGLLEVKDNKVVQNPIPIGYEF